ncbi:MAG TPA: hypothetical protein DEF51_11540 [Myxococcales bacterium]|nr:hypothetical protein [Myxococcales bacterium]
MRHDPAEDLLWIPRVLFFPIHLVMEYGIRLPVGWLLRTLEQSHIDGATLDPPDLHPDGWRWGLAPHVRYDHGFVPSAGLTFWARERGGDGRFRVGADTWGLDRLGGWLMLESRGGDFEGGLAVRGGWRIDNIFHGFGWDSAPEDRVRYARGHVSSRLSGRQRIWRGSFLEAGARLSVQRFEETTFDQAATPPAGALSALPGFDGFSALGTFARLRFDTRDGEDERFMSGVGAQLGGEWNLDAQTGSARSWARLDAELELAVEVRPDRTLALRGRVEAVEPLGDHDVPFTEQIRLGGPLDRMPGFLEGRLTGRSATSVGVAWRYAVWSWMDASVFADVGNVFGAGFEGFAVERMRLSVGFALQSTQARYFTLLVAMGTEPFAMGTNISSGRFAVGFGALP